MRLTAYIMMMLSMSIVFYWLGYGSAGSALMTQYDAQGNGTMNISDILMWIAQQATSNSSLAALLVMTLVAGTVGALLLGGFGSMYIIPMILLAAVLNWFVFPLGFIMQSGVLPDMLGIPLIVTFNVLMILTVLTFVRGGG